MAKIAFIKGLINSIYTIGTSSIFQIKDYLGNVRFYNSHASGTSETTIGDYSGAGNSTKHTILDLIKTQIFSGGVAFSSKQEDKTGGATLTINTGVRRVYINPTTLISALTITMPVMAANYDGLELYISFGGTIISGTVVTSLTISAGSGDTMLNAGVITTATAGGCIILGYDYANRLWRIIKY